MEDGTIWVYAAIDRKECKWYKFDDFQKECLSVNEDGFKNYPLAWEYYQTYFNLLADMT